jgi:hypothetical protein
MNKFMALALLILEFKLTNPDALKEKLVLKKRMSIKIQMELVMESWSQNPKKK